MCVEDRAGRAQVECHKVGGDEEVREECSDITYQCEIEDTGRKERGLAWRKRLLSLRASERRGD